MYKKRKTSEKVRDKMATFKTGSGNVWDTDRPIKTTIKVFNPKLTGNFEDHEIDGRIESMVEVDHDYGTDFIWEQFVW